jgi:C4-dicarboxylate transporter DctM subunit
MEAPLIGLIGIVILFVLLFLKIPIGFSMALVGFGGFAILRSFDGAIGVLGTVPFRLVSDYTIAVLPLFMLMGTIAANTGISRDLYNTAHTWVGQFRGGLSMATTLAAGGFAAITGSSLAGATALGKIVAPEMRRYKYDPRLAAGSVAAGGTMGVLIPPSVAFILYAMLTEQSIGRLFMAGILPGIGEIVFYIGVIFILCQINPLMGPAGPGTSFKTKLFSLRGTWAMLTLFFLVMGGIYMGIFTATEAGGIGAAGAIVITLVSRRLSREGFINSATETAQITASVIIILIGAFIFGSFLAVSKLPFMLAETVANFALPSHGILIMILFVYLILGCFFTIVPTMVLTIPIFFPVITALGLDPIWYGVLMVRMIEIGMITPPIGINCFVLSKVMDVPLGTVFRGVVPFVIADILLVALLVAFPQISLFLPNTMMGS